MCREIVGKILLECFLGLVKIVRYSVFFSFLLLPYLNKSLTNEEISVLLENSVLI